jgi:hypothetical protein
VADKTIVLSNAYGSAKVRLNKCAALAALVWTIYFLTASNRGWVAFEKRREIRQGGWGLMQWSWDIARLTRPLAHFFHNCPIDERPLLARKADDGRMLDLE